MAGLVAMLAVAAVAWQATVPEPAGDDVALLREAFDEASAVCYARYRGAALRACLGAVMGEHLKALESLDEAAQRARAAPRHSL